MFQKNKEKGTGNTVLEHFPSMNEALNQSLWPQNMIMMMIIIMIKIKNKDDV